MNSSITEPQCLVWRDGEVELLLLVLLYPSYILLYYYCASHWTTKLQENLDWESCHSKYSDTTLAFRQQDPSGGVAMEMNSLATQQNIRTKLSTKINIMSSSAISSWTADPRITSQVPS